MQRRSQEFPSLDSILPKTYEYRGGITSDSHRTNDPGFVVRVLGQVITVSLETVKPLPAPVLAPWEHHVCSLRAPRPAKLRRSGMIITPRTGARFTWLSGSEQPAAPLGLDMDWISGAINLTRLRRWGTSARTE